MNHEEKKALRGILFRHLDGIAIAPTVSALHKGGICSYLLQNPHVNFQKLSSKFETNAGYLNVALRLLASQGWLQRKILKDGEDIDLNLTDKGKSALKMSHHYDIFCHYIPTLIKFDQHLFDSEVEAKEEEFTDLILKLKNLSNIPSTKFLKKSGLVI